MVANPEEQFEAPESHETYPDGRQSIGVEAVKSTVELVQPHLNGATIYEAGFDPELVAQKDLITAIDELAEYAVGNKLLQPVEAEWWLARMKGEEAPELPEELKTGRSSTLSYLGRLVVDYAGDMNHASEERRRTAMAMKGLLLKFLGDPRQNRNVKPLSVAEIEDWVAGINGPSNRNMFNDVHPEDVQLLLAAGFDAVFRQAAGSPINR